MEHSSGSRSAARWALRSALAQDSWLVWARSFFGVESPENEAKRLVKQLYSISIDNSMARQIAGIAQQKYAGHVSIAVRDPDVRKMLMLYSEATGQKMPLSATTPQSASLAEMGGKLYQQATYVNGTP